MAYSQQSDADAGRELEGSTISTWGGMPAFTQGMVTRHMFLAGTKATKIATTYKMKSHGVHLSTTAYYVSFDMEIGFLLKKCG